MAVDADQLEAARGRLIVALDFPDLNEARSMATSLGNSVSFYKIGLELVMQGGLDLVRELKQAGHRVFLDMKLLDIANTVEKATANAAASGADFLTIHGTDTKTMQAAVQGAAGTDLKVLAVTVLTNLDDADLREQRIDTAADDLVLHRARLAKSAGCHGVISSGLEAREIRDAVGAGFIITTPGIRLPSGDKGDQARIATPEQAISDGADYLVVGRPITQAADPRAAAIDFVKRISVTL